MDWPVVLPVIVAGLVGVTILVYVILDGFDLGIGILLPLASGEEREEMIAAIGPFWDANETWLFLAIAIVAMAFPVAYDVMMPELFWPLAIMILALIMRSSAFAVGTRLAMAGRRRVQVLFCAGSLIAALAQGFILGKFAIGLRQGAAEDLLSLLSALCVAIGYMGLGAAWMIHKARGRLQRRAAHWLRRSIAPIAGAMAAMSIALPLSSRDIYIKWLTWPNSGMLMPVPVVCACLFGWLFFLTYRMPARGDRHSLKPFMFLGLLVAVAFAGLTYSFEPFIVPDRLTIWRAAAPTPVLVWVTGGAALAMLLVAACTLLAYRGFRGKAQQHGVG